MGPDVENAASVALRPQVFCPMRVKHIKLLDSVGCAVAGATGPAIELGSVLSIALQGARADHSVAEAAKPLALHASLRTTRRRGGGTPRPLFPLRSRRSSLGHGGSWQGAASTHRERRGDSLVIL